VIVDLLPPALRPAAKAVVAALVPLIGLVLTGLLTGRWDDAAIAGGLTAVVSALLVHQTPNEPRG